MNNQERYIYFESGHLQKAVQIELLDWAGYWSEALPGEITDPLLLAQTKAAVNLILSELPTMVKKVSRLAISDEIIKSASVDGVTEAMISTIVVSIMANRLRWLTGIEEIIETQE